MATISEALAIAIQHHQAGRLDAAEQIYRQILQAAPNHAGAWHLLGVIAHQGGKYEIAVQYLGRAISLNGTAAAFHSSLGEAYRALRRIDEAVACYRRSLELQPNSAEVQVNLGIAFQAQEKFDEAVACYRRALELKPNFSQAHNNLGNALQSQEKPDEAIACYRRALELSPDYANAHNSLGFLFQNQGNLEEAVASYRRALEFAPTFAEAYNNLGSALQGQGKLDEGIACCQRALELKPNYAQAHYNLGNALNEQGNLDQAVACYRSALASKPDDVTTHNDLGSVLYRQGKLPDAVACYRRALELKPGYVQADNNLGNVLTDQGKVDGAIACYRRALELKPDFAEAHNNLGIAFKDQGKLDQAVACFRRALELRPNFAAAHSNLLAARQYHAGATLAELATAHAEYDRQHAAPLQSQWRPHENVPDPHRRLRLGFVSPDFGRHPVGYFLVRALENLDLDRAETVCYSDRIVKDNLTTRFQAAATVWRDVANLSDKLLAEQIRADRIDILFDLAGHTAHNRLLVFARKPAPIQVTWAGYVGTTGLKAMDYLLADRYEVPPGAERYYRERVLRMPDDYVCYDPPDYAPPVGPLPALARGRVTFGCFNNPTKINASVVEVWAKILLRLPDARLVLKFKGLPEGCLGGQFARQFVASGIDPARLELLGPSPHAELLAEYHQIDLALDPFPYSGGLTTLEALWMGVPVITCPGETFASRHSLSHLSNVGLTEMIAHDLDEYVDLAAALAGDRQRLAALRAGLRERMAASPLCDGKRFAANLASLLRGVWQLRVE